MINSIQIYSGICLVRQNSSRKSGLIYLGQLLGTLACLSPGTTSYYHFNIHLPVPACIGSHVLRLTFCVSISFVLFFFTYCVSYNVRFVLCFGIYLMYWILRCSACITLFSAELLPHLNQPGLAAGTPRSRSAWGNVSWQLFTRYLGCTPPRTFFGGGAGVQSP